MRPQVVEAGRRRRARRPGRSVAAQTPRQQVEVRAGQRAVPADVGDDVARAAVGVEPGQHLVELAALLGPAAGRQRGAAHVEADGDPVAVPAMARAHPLGVLQRGRAEVDPGAAGGQRGLQRGVVADAAGQLDLRRRAGRRPRRAARGCSPRPNAASRSTRWIHSAPACCQASAASSGSPYDVSVPASPWTRRTAWPSATSTAGSSTSRAHGGPRTQLASSGRTGVAGLLGVELGRRQRPVLHRRHERLAVRRPRSRGGPAGWSTRRRAAPSGARRRSARSRTARARCPRTARIRRPRSTVFQPMCGSTGASQPLDVPGPLAEPSVRTPCSSPVSNSTCMPTQMPSTGRPPASRSPITVRPADRPQALHAGGERADARARPVRRPRMRGVRVGGDLDVGAGPRERALRRPQVAGAVVEDDDARAVAHSRRVDVRYVRPSDRCYRVPLVPGRPRRAGRAPPRRAARAPPP